LAATGHPASPNINLVFFIIQQAAFFDFDTFLSFLAPDFALFTFWRHNRCAVATAHGLNRGVG